METTSTIILVRSHGNCAPGQLVERLSEETQAHVLILNQVDDQDAVSRKEGNIITWGARYLQDNRLLFVPDYGWRCGDYPLYVADDFLPDYQDMWLIEPDVHLNFGHQSEFFEYFRGDRSDLAATRVWRMTPEWSWFGTMKPYVSEVFGCLFPIVKISRRAVRHLKSERQRLTALHLASGLEDQLWPNDEAFCTSILKNAGYKVLDLNAMAGTELYNDETFSFIRPHLAERLLRSDKDNKIYHPALSGAGFLRKLEQYVGTIPASGSIPKQLMEDIAQGGFSERLTKIQFISEIDTAHSKQEMELVAMEVDAVNAIDSTKLKYIVTAFRTVLYHVEEADELRHNDLENCDKNRLVALYDGKLFVTDGDRLIKRVSFDDSIGTGGAGETSFVKDGLFLVARPDGSIGFESSRLDIWEKFTCVNTSRLARLSWRPATPAGGTELTLQGLRRHLGPVLEHFNILLNNPAANDADTRPVICWCHNDIDIAHPAFIDATSVGRVAKFVFVSDWLRQRYIERFSLPSDKCFVIHNAIEPDEPGAQWTAIRPWRLRFAFTSAPYRGLGNLIRAWKKLDLDAELHIWSGVRLWAGNHSDVGFRELFALASDTRNVIFHGIAPNETIREALRDMHFLLMPSDFQETFCIAAVEALAAGCRVIAPSIGALPEVVGGNACLYEHPGNEDRHIEVFCQTVQMAIDNPWGGDNEARSRQIAFVRDNYSWPVISGQWKLLLQCG